MTSELEPLDPELRALLDDVEGGDPKLAEPVRHAMERRLELALAATAVAPVTPATPALPTTPRASASRWARAARLAVAGLAGATAALLVERAALHSAPGVPRGDAVPVVPSVDGAPVASAPVPTPVTTPAPPPRVPQPAPSATPTPARAPGSDGDLVAEGRLVDTARAALAHGDFAAALAATERHRASFPAGQLREEAEAIAIQALVGAGRFAEARARAAAFRARYPQSLFHALIDAALRSIP